MRSPQRPCPKGTFSCDNGTKCVLQSEICDRKDHCLDKQDENPVKCGLIYGSTEFYFRDILPNGTTTKSIKHFEKCDLKIYPKKCICRQQTGLICNYSNLTEVPKVSPQVTSLILFHNRIKLTSHSFQGLNVRQQIQLQYNNISYIPFNVFHQQKHLRKLYLNNNQIRKISTETFHGLHSLEWLFLDSNKLSIMPLIELEPLQSLKWLTASHNLLTLKNERFPMLKNIYELILEHNLIEEIDEHLFARLGHLHLLSLSYNKISYIHHAAFRGLTDLRDLRISNNRLHYLPANIFEPMKLLDVLFIGNNKLEIRNNLFQFTNISYLNLEGIEFEDIDFNEITKITNLLAVAYTKFYYCSMTPHIMNCLPNTDGVSSLENLLSNPVLRYSAWLMATITCIGNVLVLWGRFTYRDENKAVSMVIRNLAVSDILMGLYLSIIGIQDIRYREKYHEVSLDWIASWRCAATGVLAMVSSEVSLLILAFMSVERFLLIADPFGGHRRINTQNVFVFLLTIWLVGCMIAIIPLIHWRSTRHFYGTYSGTCFPLHTQERFPIGWQYSAFVFLGINMFLLVLIATLYTALLISIWRTRKATPLAMLDCEFAIRFFFIVLTDASCWVPIMAMKIFTFFSYEISADVFAWLVVFVLPLNSAVNPLLYTFTTPKYRNQILLRGWNKFTSRKDLNKLNDGSGNSNQGRSLNSNLSRSKRMAIDDDLYDGYKT